MTADRDSDVAPATSIPATAADWLRHAEQDAAIADARRALSRASGLADDELLEGLRRLGLTPEALPALELAPAVLIGWADGTLSRLERDRLRVLALRHGIGEDHPAWATLQRWMLHRPDPHAERVLLAALHARIERLPVRARRRRRAAILQDCDAVARAAGRILGGPKVCRDERGALARVGAELGA